MSERILRINEVVKRLGISRSQVYNLIEKGDLPKQIAIGERSSGFLESEIDEWIKSKVAASRADSPEVA